MSPIISFFDTWLLQVAMRQLVAYGWHDFSPAVSLHCCFVILSEARDLLFAACSSGLALALTLKGLFREGSTLVVP
jgi:hypothetical protein